MAEQGSNKRRSWRLSFLSSQEFKIPEEIEEPISVDLSLKEKTHQAGSRIHGSISLSVPSSAAGCNDFSGIHLSLEGNETIDAQSNIVGVELSLGQDMINIVTMDKEVVRFSSPLVEGQHDYSFDLQVPDSLPSSMHSVADDVNNPSICEVKYTLKAYLLASSPKPEFTTTTSEEPIQITAATDNRVYNNNDADGGSLVEPKAFKMKSWLSKKGSIELGLDTDTKVASPGSNVTVGITGRNISSLSVKELLVQWVETVRWGGDCEESESRRILAETILAGSSLPPSWQQKRKRKQKHVVLSSIPADRIESRLQLDDSARNSYKGQIVEVHHSLEVTAVTKSTHSPNPKVTTLLEVYGGK